MILSDRELKPLMRTLVGHEDMDFLNPASIDICIGETAEIDFGKFDAVDLRSYTKKHPYLLRAQQFANIATFETITVPKLYAVDLRLKSSRAREGYNHSLAFWVDPGWSGVLTMEIQNVLLARTLPLYPGLRIAQIIVHELSSLPVNPYCGKYNNATTVQRSKELT